jgi:membrane protein implicated in regulation of membrane protease activity
MLEWYSTLTILEQIYLWGGIIATFILIVQIILLCLSSFGGDLDLDGDGDIDIDTDSGVSIFTVKSITAFFAVGCWAGLLTAVLVQDNLQWLSVVIAVIAGVLAMMAVVLIYRGIAKLQCNGAVQTDKLVGQRASVYVAIPASRQGRGKVTLTAQGRFMELDAVTDDAERLLFDQTVEIVSAENECVIVKKFVDSTDVNKQ